MVSNQDILFFIDEQVKCLVDEMNAVEDDESMVYVLKFTKSQGKYDALMSIKDLINNDKDCKNI